MITSNAFAGKHFAVLGLARSGLATVEALLASGAKVTAWDDNEEARQKILPGTGRGTSFAGGGVPQTLQGTTVGPLHHVSHGPPPRSGEDLQLSDFTTADLTVFDSIVVTPGLPLNRHPIAARARAAGVEIIGDIELFARARAELPPHKVVGITGTNGKSTTTALVHHILHTAGVPSLMGGNIGLPILAQDPLPAGGVYVLELSSYQLDLTQTLDCDVAVLLNITPDHLDRYPDFAHYASSKERLFAMQSKGNLAVVGRYDKSSCDVQNRIRHVQKRLDDIRPFFGEMAPMQSNWPALQGSHNVQNAFAAIATIMALGSEGIDIQRGLRTFSGLPHRMEHICEQNGVVFVNDSKATNPTAAAPALAAYPAVRWILGGQAKSNNLDECAPSFGHVRKAYTIGEASALFASLLKPHVAVAECGTLDAAVKAAAAEAQPGDTVLLSPACASFDQFTDFEARGNAFRAAVEAL